MNVMLKSFTQEAQLSDPSDVKHVLVFEVNGRDELRLPVPEETVKALMKAIYVDHAPTTAYVPKPLELDKEAFMEMQEEVSEEETDEEDAEEFGGDTETPESEEDIPSL